MALNNGGLVETGNYGLFAQKALVALQGYDKWLERAPVRVQKFNFTKTWNEVGINVLSVLNKISQWTAAQN